MDFFDSKDNWENKMSESVSWREMNQLSFFKFSDELVIYMNMRFFLYAVWRSAVEERWNATEEQRRSAQVVVTNLQILHYNLIPVTFYDFYTL